MKFSRTLLASALLALAAASPLSAQMIGVRVLDRGSGQPVPEVNVEALREGEQRPVARARTDREGYAVLVLPERGDVLVRASRVGYQSTTSQPVTVELRQTLETQLRIASSEVVLDPLTVTARSEPPRSRVLEREEFYDRERSSMGKFLTRYEIQQAVRSQSSEIFAGIPGIRMGQTSGRSRIVTISRGGRNCVPKLIVDNGPMPMTELDGIIQPDQIAGIEIYRGPNELPARWMAENNNCGLIVIWTDAGQR